MGLSIFAQYGLILHGNVDSFFCTIPLDKKQTFLVCVVINNLCSRVHDRMQGPLQELDQVPYCGGLLLWQAGKIWKIFSIVHQSVVYGLNIGDPPHWLLPKALCPQFQSGWLAGGNRCFLRKEIGKFCFCINIASKLGKPLRCKSLTCVWQFHCEAVRYMGSGLGRGKWLNHLNHFW